MAQDPLRKALRISYLVSLAFALALSGTFFTYTSLQEGYNALARYGGAFWVFLLGLIIALPTVAPMMKRRFRE